jgi:CBS-domain-containing membrane protein
MKEKVRRLAVTDSDGRLVGILAVCDLVRHAWTAHLRGEEAESGLPELLESVSRPRQMLSPLSKHEREVLAEYYAP